MSKFRIGDTVRLAQNLPDGIAPLAGRYGVVRDLLESNGSATYAVEVDEAGTWHVGEELLWSPDPIAAHGRALRAKYGDHVAEGSSRISPQDPDLKAEALTQEEYLGDDVPSFGIRERRAQEAWDATHNTPARTTKRPMDPAYRAGYHQALIDTARKEQR